MNDDFFKDFTDEIAEVPKAVDEALPPEDLSAPPSVAKEINADVPEADTANTREEIRNSVENPYSNPYIQQRPRVINEAIPPMQIQNPAGYIPGNYSVPTVKENKKGKKSSRFVPFIIGVAITLVFCITVAGIATIFIGKKIKNSNPSGDNGNNSAESSIVINDTPRTDTDIKSYDTVLTPAQVAAKIKPSVVSIITYDTSSMFSQSQSQGSGIIYSADGYIITNSHVIGDTANNRVTVILSDTKKEYEAKVLGYDTTTDLAVLKIDANNLTPAEFGNSDALVSGDMVLAVGNPGGVLLAGSVSVGYISGINRVIDGDGTSTSAMKYIQTDAAINPGNSGGALVNMYGEVIGINTAKIAGSDYEGLGFAIPIITAQPIIEDLSNIGYVTGRVKLGIKCNEISETMARYYGVPQGLYIQSIDSDSDLNGKVGIGDIITKIDGKKISSVSDVQDILTGMNEGQTVNLSIYRAKTYYNDEKTFDVTVKVIADKGTNDTNNNSNSNNGGNGGYGNGYSFGDFFNGLF